MNEERRCKVCGVWKPLFMFPRDKECSLGYRHDCCNCRNTAKRARNAGRPKPVKFSAINAACNVALNNFRAAEPANDLYWRVA